MGPLSSGSVDADADADEAAGTAEPDETALAEAAGEGEGEGEGEGAQEAVAEPAAPVAPVAPEHAPPYLDRIHPPQLTLTGGPIAIFGAAFHAECVLTFDGEPLAFEREHSALLRAEAPPRNAPGVAEVRVANPAGAHAIAMILYVQGPRVDRLVPAKAPRAGGVEVVIEGDGFTPWSAVSLFDERAPEVVFDGPTRLRFVAPARAEAPGGAVVVTNPDGTSFRLGDAFVYEDDPPPSIAAVEPPRAWVTGGARLTVRGANFSRGAAVRLGETDLPTTFESAEALVVIAPPASQPGPVRVRVRNADGASAERDGAFRYEPVPAPPKLVELSPRRGPTAGGQTLTLVGENFDAATVVRIGEVSCIPRVLGPNRLEIVTPARAEGGAVDLELIGDGVPVRFETAYLYEARRPPSIASVSPGKGPTSGGTKLVIEGEAFAEDCAVRVGREAVRTRVLRSETRLEVLTPPSATAGLVDVEIFAPGAAPAVAKKAFLYEAQPPPVITSVAPARGGTGGGTELSIEGKAFAAGCLVTVGGKPAQKVKVLSPTSIEALTPAGAHGQLVDVVVKNPDGKEAAVKRAFQYDQRYG